MQHILFATKEDVLEIKQVMDTALETSEHKDWYVTDTIEFIEQHISKEGYTLKFVVDGKIAGFLIVRHPLLAEDNLGYYLLQNSVTKEVLCKVAHMESAAVLPKYRGQNIQRKLLQRAEEIESERGTTYLMSTVHPENCYSMRNLQQLGYRCYMETEKYGGLKRKILYKEIRKE